MKAYGVRKKDIGCCPGHDKFSDQKYNSNRSIRAHSRDTKLAHRRGRKFLKNELRKNGED